MLLDKPAKFLLGLRKKKEWTQRQMGQLMGMSQAPIANAERGQPVPLWLFMKLAEVHGFRVYLTLKKPRGNEEKTWRLDVADLDPRESRERKPKKKPAPKRKLRAVK